MNFHQPSLHVQDLSTFQVHREDSPSNNGVILAFLSTSSVSTSIFRVSTGPSINFPYVRGTFYQLLVDTRPSVNFCQLSVTLAAEL